MIRVTRHLVRSAAVLLLAACHVWQVEPLPSPRTMEWDHPVRVTTSNAFVLQLSSARVRRDTLVGVLRTTDGDSLVTLPMSRVWTIEARKFSGDRTRGLLFGVPAASLAVAVAYALIRFLP